MRSSSRHIRRARRAVAKDDRTRAIAAYERALEGGRAPRSWWVEYAAALERCERWVEAADATERAMTSDGSADEYARLAELRNRAGDRDAAIAALRTATERSPEVASWHGRLGRLYERKRDHTQAIAAYRRATELAPDIPGWHYQLGRVLERAERWQDAAVAYQRAVDLEPGRATWHGRLGRVRRRIGAWHAAARAYEDAAFRDVEEPEWWFRAGAVRERARDWIGAAAAFRAADRCAAVVDPQAPAPSMRLPYDKRIHLGLLRKPAYAYLLLRSAQLAKRLGIDRIAAIEFGVAGGNGLLAMEMHAEEVTAETGVSIDVIGFDTGEGLYEPVDYRDMPYFFSAGLYSIDAERLRARLRSARLVLGDAAVTFAEHLDAGPPIPIGAMSFDMDVYSATAAVLRHLGDGATHDRFLPRTSVYFDDVFGHEGQAYNRFTGELLAIDEFNDENDQVKLAEDRAFRSLPISFGWQHGIYTLHRFRHPEYNTFVSPATADSLRLRD